MMLSTRLAVSALTLAGLAAPALAQDLQYELVNDSGEALMELYVSAAGEGGGGDDLLGAQVGAEGETVTVSLPGSASDCQRDFRFVLGDGSERVETIDVCAAGSYTITQ